MFKVEVCRGNQNRISDMNILFNDIIPRDLCCQLCCSVKTTHFFQFSKLQGRIECVPAVR